MTSTYEKANSGAQNFPIKNYAFLQHLTSIDGTYDISIFLVVSKKLIFRGKYIAKLATFITALPFCKFFIWKFFLNHLTSFTFFLGSKCEFHKKLFRKYEEESVSKKSSWLLLHLLWKILGFKHNNAGTKIPVQKNIHTKKRENVWFFYSR